MAFNNYAEVTNSDNIAVTDRTSTGPAPDGSAPAGSADWSSITGTPTSAAGYGIVNGSELDAFAAEAASGTGYLRHTGANTWAIGNFVTDLDYVQYDITAGDPAHQEGRVFWDVTDHSLAYYTDVVGVKCNLGQEQWMRARNTTGSTIVNGAVVYITGALGNRPTIGLADASAFATSKLIGVVTNDIANNADGYVTVYGIVHDLDTSAWVAGTVLYLSETPGLLTDVMPAYPAYDVQVAVVIRSNPANGEILVCPKQAIEHASETARGDIELATQAETNTGTDDTRAVTPLKLATYAAATYQPLDADLTAIAALTTTGYGRDFLTLADASAARTYIGAGTSSFSGAFGDLTGIPTTLSGYGITDAQPLDSDLTAIAALSSNGYARRTGAGAWTIDAFVPTTLGGTGITSYAEGDLLYGTAGGVLAKLAAPALPGYVLGSTAGVPAWEQLSTLTATTVTGTANQVLVNGTSGSGQTGPVTLSLPQNIATSSSPQFAQLGIGGAAVSTHAIAIHSSTDDVVMGNAGVQAFFPALAGRGIFIQRNGIAGAHLFSASQTSTFIGAQADGTLASPSATTSGRAFNLAGAAYDGTNWFVNSRARLECTQNQTASARGSKFGVDTILNGSTGLAERFAVSGTGSIELGVKATAATTATDGFVYIPTCAGTPTGAPTAVTGLAPLIVDTTNNKLYFYSGGAWRDAGP